jgi:hypothetical protein
MYQFLQGRYIAMDLQRMRNAPRPTRPIGGADRVIRSTIDLASGERYYTEYDWIGAPETLGYEGRVFVAEHDAEGVDWDQWGIPGIYHTSIVGGIWRVERQRRRVHRYPRTPIISSSPQETFEEIVTQAKFAGWRVGNGASSTYDQGDILKLFYQFSGSTWEDVDRILFGYYPTAGGRYYPIRGVAYSVGNYGIHWVCHQTANAFSVRRWNIAPVGYPASVLLHHFFGNKGISERTDVLGTHHGCVPGVWCYYNVTPPYSVIVEPLTLTAMEEGMTGAGYLLNKLWNRGRNQWIDSEAQFDSVLVPCRASDDMIAVDRVG